jgi:cell division septal protein FtsQ
MQFEPTPPPSEPDRRYWRRHANRRVRKARRVKGLIDAGRMLVLPLLMGGVLTYSAMQIAYLLSQSREFELTNVDVEGASRTTPAGLRARLASLTKRNLLDLDLAEVVEKVKTDPWVSDATAKKILPHTLRVRVVERTPAALAVIEGVTTLVDAGGTVIGPTGAGLVYDFPVLTGLDVPSVEPAPARLAAGVAAIARLRAVERSWAEGISEIDLSRPDRLAVVTKQPGPRIFLDRSLVERNLEDYLALRSEIEDRVGPLEYVDLRWSHRINVRPAASAPESETR